MSRSYTFDSVAGLNRTLRQLPKEASAELRDASLDIAEDVARKAAMRARMVGGVLTYVAPTIKARRDRVPKIVMGGMTRLPPRGGVARQGATQTVGNVIWGGEFGSDRFRQFDPWRGSDTGAGYALWPTVRGESDETMQRYGDALMRAVDAAASRND